MRERRKRQLLPWIAARAMTALFFYATRVTAANVSAGEESIDGFDADRMRERTLLTAEEEKTLLRRIDWHLTPLCSIIFMFKNLDSDNVPNAHIYYLRAVLYYVAEAGQFPGVILQMCYWYRPDEMSLRLLYFYICGNVSGIFGWRPAFAFDHASGSYGLSGWQRLFLSEGTVTIVVGIAVWFLLPDFPATASWLTDREKRFTQARLPPNAPRAEEQNFQFSKIVESLKDGRLWLFTSIWAIYTAGTSGVRSYQATVIANLGFTNIATAHILNIPITVTSLLVIGIAGVISDSGRFPRPVYPPTFLAIIVACYGVVAYPSNGAVYAATLIGNAVTSAWFPMMRPRRVQTTSRATGSAFSIGFANSYGQIGGAVGSQIFRSIYAPHYTVPFTVAMYLVSGCIAVTPVTWWVTRHTERDTRRLKLARKAAEARGETILEDVVDNDLKPRR